MAKRDRKKPETTPRQTVFVAKLEQIIAEKFGRRIPHDCQTLIEALGNPQNMVRKDKNSPVTLRTDKNFKVERSLEYLLDEFSPEEILHLVPETLAETKEYHALINQCGMGRDEDTIWRRITGYADVNRAWTRLLAEKLAGRKCLEIMAGNGLLCRMLQDAGCQIMATDIAPDKTNEYVSMRNGNFTDVMGMDAITAIRRFGRNVDVLVCSWPPQGDETVLMALKAFLRLKPDGVMVYIGEDKGGVNACDVFFDETQIIDPLPDVNALHQSLPGSRDRIRIITLNKDPAHT